MPWASGVLRGSGCSAAEEENDTSELASIDARQGQLSFIARCLAVPGKAVNGNATVPTRAGISALKSGDIYSQGNANMAFVNPNSTGQTSPRAPSCSLLRDGRHERAVQGQGSAVIGDSSGLELVKLGEFIGAEKCAAPCRGPLKNVFHKL